MANQASTFVPDDFEDRYPDADAKSTECALNLVFTADLMVKRTAQLLQPFDLTPASGLDLSLLADSESPFSPNEIAERLNVSRATITGLVDSLERRGYAQRLPHSSDRRMLVVGLTEKGREVAVAFRPVVHQQQKMWLKALTKKERRRFNDALRQLQAGLSDANS